MPKSNDVPKSEGSSSYRLQTAIPEQFVRYALKIGAIELIPGGRPLKSGRLSPYFFNSGKFDSAEAMLKLGSAYVVPLSNNMTFDSLYGPPYKGTILAPAVAMYLGLSSSRNYGVRFCTSRKEVKDHGEGGSLIGAPINPGDRVVIIDDVITDGATKHEALEFIRARGGVPVGLVIALDRQERGLGELSAVQEFERDYGVPVRSVATLADLISVLRQIPAESGDDETGEMLEQILAYQQQYGIVV
ncbi:MAG: orotate phosphoribosyltransferase [Minisyncoccota bacterium]